jgi:hypothetical protein
LYCPPASNANRWAFPCKLKGNIMTSENPIKSESPISTDDVKGYLLNILPDLMFVLLPFIVIILVQIVKGTVSQFLSVTEWAFAAAVLTGQTIVKVTASVIDAPVSLDNRKKESRQVAFIVSTIIVIILIPSLFVLFLMLYLDTPSPWLVAAQIFLFVLALLLYTIFSVVSLAVVEKRINNQTPKS